MDTEDPFKSEAGCHNLQVSTGIVYRIMIPTILLWPALVFQTVQPLLEEDLWESVNDSLYRWLLNDEDEEDKNIDSQPESTGQGKSVQYTDGEKVAVILVGPKSRNALGYPVHRRHFIELLGALKEGGHPWILSDLKFDDLQAFIAPGKNKRRLSRKERRRRKELRLLDRLWLRSLKNYGRYIGSSVVKGGDSAELSFTEFSRIRKKITIPQGSLWPDPGAALSVPIRLASPLRYVQAEPVAGISGLSPVITGGQADCIATFLVAQEEEDGILPSSLLWAFAYGSRSGLVFPSGARWPFGGKQPFLLRRSEQVPWKYCLPSPSLSDRGYLKKRNIRIYELSELLKNVKSGKNRRMLFRKIFSGRVVLLSSDLSEDLSGYIKGSHPGILSALSKARHLNELLSFRSIRRNPHFSWPWLSWLPIALAGLLIPVGLAFSVVKLLLLELILLCGLLFSGIFQLWSENTLMFPLEGMGYLLASIMGTLIALLVLKIVSDRRLRRFDRLLRDRLCLCLNFEDMVISTQSVCASEFSVCKIFFLGYDQKLHEAAAGWDEARTFINQALRDHSDLDAVLRLDAGEFDQRRSMFQTVLTSLKKASAGKIKKFGESILDAKIAISHEGVRLGTLDVQLNFSSWEESSVVRMINSVQSEVTRCWARQEEHARQRIREFSSISGKVSGGILAQFLSPVLIARFDVRSPVEANLRQHLRPKPSQVTMIQADIKGITDSYGDFPVEKIVAILQRCYLNVIEEARRVAHVRLLGDSIFIFIEEKSILREGVSSADLALLLASALVRQAEKQNDRGEAMPVNFGLAIHRGEVILGNLSGDVGIEYTAIGQNVNLVARTEELTRIPKIQEMIGPDAILMTAEARNGLEFFAGADCKELILDSVGFKIRSFPMVSKLYYIDRHKAITIANRATVTRMLNPELPLV